MKLPQNNLSRTIGIVGWKNSGKTTLVEELVQILVKRGLNVATVKHAHHEFEIDHEGKDSFRHRKAGASEVLVASAKRWALIHENASPRSPDLTQLVQNLSPHDVILAEGFKTGSHRKIEVYRDERQELLAAQDTTIQAVIAQRRGGLFASPCPILWRDEVETIADFVVRLAFEFNQR